MNMKKSWHPLLLKNQERVWLEEKKAVSICVRCPVTSALIAICRSSRRRRNLTSFGRRKKKNVSCKSFNVYKRNRLARNGKRN